MPERSSGPATRIPAGALPARISSRAWRAPMRCVSIEALSACSTIAVLITPSVRNPADGLRCVLALHPGAIDAARDADRSMLLVNYGGALRQNVHKQDTVMLPQLDCFGHLEAMAVAGDLAIGQDCAGPAPRASRVTL